MTRTRSTLVCLLVLLAYASGATRALHLHVHHALGAAPGADSETTCAGDHGACPHGGADSGVPGSQHGEPSHGDRGCGLCECLATGGFAPAADQLLPTDIIDPLRRAVCVGERVTATASVRLAGARAPPVGA